MAKLALLLMFLVAAANLSLVLSYCDYTTACRLGSYGNEDQACRAAFSYLDCLQQKYVNNPDCSAVETEIETVIKSAKDMLKKYGCDGATSLIASLVVTLGLSGLVYFLTSSQ